MATQYKQKILTVEAMQYTGSNIEEMLAFCPKLTNTGNRLMFANNTAEILPSHWVIKDTSGAFYPHNETFLSYYEPVP